MRELKISGQIEIEHDSNNNTFLLKFADDNGVVTTIVLTVEQLLNLESVIKIHSPVSLKSAFKAKVVNTGGNIVTWYGGGDWPFLSETEANIYVNETMSVSAQEELVNACGDFMEALGFEMKAEEEPIFNSFWQRVKFVLKNNVTENDFDRLFRRGKQALELKHVDLPNAEQTEKLATAAEKVITSLDKCANATIRLGSLVVIKQTVDDVSSIVVHQLTSDQVYYLNQNPEVIKDPDQLGKIIQKSYDQQKPPIQLGSVTFTHPSTDHMSDQVPPST